MKRKSILLFLLLSASSVPLFSQVVFWSENFNNGCSSNCNVSGYSGSNGAWSVTNTGSNGNIANEFFVSCAENGEPVGSCGAGCGNDATLHVGSVPCSLCLLCPNGDCGATYNAGPAFGGEDPATDKRAMSPLISTLGKSNITLSFKYIERGQGTTDDATVEYSINGGTSWNQLTNPAKTPAICPGGQGLWTSFSVALPAACDSISNLKIGFRWANNSNTGTDPSFAVDEVELSSAASTPPLAAFSTPNTTFCDSTCVAFTDQSQNSPTSWNWLFPGATPSSFNGQSPSNICYNVPGTFDVTLIVTNAAGSDTLLKPNFITVNSCFLPQVSFIASDSAFCEKGCIDFTDLSTNNPLSWQWYFPGASPDTSTLQNPTGICYNAYGTYPVKLVATNVIGSDSAVYNSYIIVHPNPPAPTANLSGGNILTSTPALSYQWYYNAVPIGGGVFQVYVAQATGDYFVIITDSNGCQSVSNIVYVGFQGTGNTSTGTPISLFPNPVQDQLYVNIHSLKLENIHLLLQDLSGRLLWSESILLQPGVSRRPVPVGSLEKGTYLLIFQGEQGKFIEKIIKE